MIDNRDNDIIDLNIGKSYLSGWTKVQAVRELIANALDEREDGEIEILKIRDSQYSIKNEGSEIQPEHFIIKERDKQSTSGKIGIFGIGLKDAIAVLTIKGVKIEIATSEYIYKPIYRRKSDRIEEESLFIQIIPNYRGWKGTEVILDGCTGNTIEEAKRCFLKYRKEYEVLDKNKYGEIILEKNTDNNGTIYFNGLEIAKESKFKFSYNITNLDSNFKSGLSREKKEVKREVYSKRVEMIIDNTDNDIVLNEYYNTLRKSINGTVSGELIYKTTLVKTIYYQVINKKIDIVIFCEKNMSKYNDKFKEVSNNKFKKAIKLKEKHYEKLISSDLLKFEKIFDYNYQFYYITIKEKDLEYESKYALNHIKNLIRYYLYDYIDVSNVEILDIEIILYEKELRRILLPEKYLESVKECFIGIVNSIKDAHDEGDLIKDIVIKRII